MLVEFLEIKFDYGGKENVTFLLYHPPGLLLRWTEVNNSLCPSPLKASLQSSANSLLLTKICMQVWWLQAI